MRRTFSIAAIALLLIAMFLAGGCSNGKLNMLMGRWKLNTVGNGDGSNQQQYPLPVVIDIYPNHTINLLESSFGKWTMDRDTFTFKSDDGTIGMTGGFKIEYITDQNTGATTPTLTVMPDNEDVTYVLQKTADLGPLESALREKAKQSAAPAPAATATTQDTATATAGS